VDANGRKKRSCAVAGRGCGGNVLIAERYWEMEMVMVIVTVLYEGRKEGREREREQELELELLRWVGMTWMLTVSYAWLLGSGRVGSEYLPSYLP